MAHGPPAFQSNAVQQNAFQSGVPFVASNYSLGSPVFGFGNLLPHLRVSTYSLGSPSFANPLLTATAAGAHKSLHANPYSLGALSFAAPSLRPIYNLHAFAFSVGSPTYGTAGVPIGIHQLQRLSVNLMAVGPPDFGHGRIVANYQITAQGFSLSGFSWPSVGPLFVIQSLAVNAYWLDSPRFGYPRLQWSAVAPGYPPTFLSQIEDAARMLNGLLNLLMASVPAVINDQTNSVRRLISIMQGDTQGAVRDPTLGTQLQAIYQGVAAAGSSYTGIEAARQYLMQQSAGESLYSQALFRSALLMTLSAESLIITNIKFTNQDDAKSMIMHVQDMFEEAKAVGIDDIDVMTYQALNALGGKLVSYLSSAVLQLPRLVKYDARFPMPSLYLAQRIYRNPTKSDEIEGENAVVNPAFCPRILRVLSEGV
jgi:hypothetical protein